MQVLNHLKRVMGSVAVIGAALLTTGCLDRTPEQSGVSTSTNAGDSWQAIPDLQSDTGDRPDVFPPLEVTAVGASVAQPDRVFAGTEDDLFVTADAGKGWTSITGRLDKATAVDVQDILVSPRNPNLVYVAGVSNGYGKVFRSTDGGKTFRAAYTTATPKRSVNAVAFGSDDATVFAGDQEGNLVRSRDRGDSWQRVFSAGSAVSALATSGTNLFVGTFEQGIFHSANDGSSFRAVNRGLRNQARTIWSLAVGDGSLFAGTQAGLFRTTDFGRTWRAVNNPEAQPAARVQAVAVGGGTVYFASNSVVYRLSADDQRFIPRQIDLAQTVTDLFPVSASRVYAGASSKDLESAEQFRNGLPILQGGPVPGR